MLFELKAVDSSKQVTALRLESVDEAAARQMARERGYSVLSVTRKSQLWATPLRSRPFPVGLFSIQLLSLLEAGLNVVEALRALAENESGASHRRLLSRLLEELNCGLSLSQAVERFPEVFSPLYVATVRSSEQTGDLKIALARYIAYQDDLDKLRRKVLSALIYPAILAVVGAAVLAFLTMYVVPRFALVYQDMATELPVFSSALVIVGTWVDRNTGAVLTAMCTLAGVVFYSFVHPGARAFLVLQLWRLPVLGEHLRIYQLARFYRTVGMLLRAGIPMLQALGLVGGLLGSHLQRQLVRAVTLLDEGQPVSKALGAAGLTTPVAAHMLAVGQRTGALGELMERIARFCDDETARWVDTFLRIFEPVVMATIGILVGGVVALMYMPVFELAGSIQ